MKKVLSIILLGATAITFACSNSESQETNIQEKEQIQGKKTDINVQEFEKVIKETKGTILDVRTPEEWAEGIIEGAIKANFYDDGFKSQLEKLDKSNPVFVYCKSGGRSGKAANQLKEMGFVVYNLLGGITAWNDSGKQTKK